MAISINPLTYVITVPKADMTQIQTSPFEIRRLDANVFHRALRTLHATEAQGIYEKTHNHSAPTTIGGIALARVVEVLPPYTVTFEDGQYAVDIFGANTNILDRANLNQVSIRPQNSAGLIQTETTSGLTTQESARLEFIEKLLQADEFYDKSTGLLHYYERGTTIDIIVPKTVTGATAIGDVSALE